MLHNAHNLNFKAPEEREDSISGTFANSFRSEIEFSGHVYLFSSEGRTIAQEAIRVLPGISSLDLLVPGESRAENVFYGLKKAKASRNPGS